MQPAPAFSPYGLAAAEPSPVARMMSAFAADFRDGIDINLGVGYVNEATIPADLVREAVAMVLTQPGRYRQPLNYGAPRGAPELIAALRDFHLRCGVGGLDGATLARNGIVIGGNGATSLLDAFADVLAPGVVVVSEPHYYIYASSLLRRGFTLLPVPEDADGLDPAAVAAAIEALGDRKQDLRFIYAVSVGNPSCSVLANDRRHGLAHLAARLSRELGRQVPLVVDMAYELLLHDPAAPPFESALLHDEAGVVYEVGTLSKVVAPGLRIGYLIGPEGPLMASIIQRTSDAGFSAPLLNQLVAAYFLERHMETQWRQVCAGYRDKAGAMRDAIERGLGERVEACIGGRAGFYYYLTLRDADTTEGGAFFRYAARQTGDPDADTPGGVPAPKVVYLPGSHCVAQNGPLAGLGRRQLRLSYGYEQAARFDDALRVLGEAADYARSVAHGG